MYQMKKSKRGFMMNRSSGERIRARAANKHYSCQKISIRCLFLLFQNDHAIYGGADDWRAIVIARYSTFFSTFAAE
jgi:hypothetical protein